MEREVGRFCFEMWAQPQAGRLLLLSGNNGTGKTHCARTVQRWIAAVGHGKTWWKDLATRRFIDNLYWHWPRLLDVLKGGEWSVVEDMMRATLLIIDELGGGHDPSGVGVDKLCQILSRRENMWTLITTNILPAEWESKFDRRVASRFFRHSTLVDLSDVPDFGATH